MPDAPSPVRIKRRLPLEWLGILPFVAFALMFLILPTMKIVIGAFQSPDGGFTFQNLIDLNTDSRSSCYFWWVPPPNINATTMYTQFNEANIQKDVDVSAAWKLNRNLKKSGGRELTADPA